MPSSAASQSETELKRLVGQLEKTRSDLKSDLREVQWRLDKEGREFHHHDEVRNSNSNIPALSLSLARLYP